MEKLLKCDMAEDCTADVGMIDEKGYVYCREHGMVRREFGRHCRMLRPHELNKLRRGEPRPAY